MNCISMNVSQPTTVHHDNNEDNWLLVEVLDVIMFPPPGHGVLLTETLDFLSDFIPVPVMFLDIVRVLNNNFVRLAVVRRVGVRIVT